MLACQIRGACLEYCIMSTLQVKDRWKGDGARRSESWSVATRIIGPALANVNPGLARHPGKRGGTQYML